MRRILSVLLAASALLLCGCGELGAEAYEVEQLRVMQTIGLDKAPGGVALSLSAAAGADPAGEARCFRAVGPDIARAMSRVQEQSTEEELFCGHLKQLLVGENLARQGLAPVLSYVARSADLRLDMPLFILKGGDAGTLMAEAGGQDRGTTELMEAVETRLKLRCGVPPFTVCDLYRALSRSDSGVVWALERQNAAEADSESLALVPAGLALVRNGRLVRYADMDQALGFCLLMNRVGVWELGLRDRFGRAAVLELRQGETGLEPEFGDDGRLHSLAVSANVRAFIAECPVGADPQSSAYEEELTALLEAEVSRQISQALRLMQQQGADYVGLGRRLEQAAPGKPAQPFVLPEELTLSISVRGELEHSSDIGEAVL